MSSAKQDLLVALVAATLAAAGLPVAAEDGAAPGYRPFRGLAAEGPHPTCLVRWAPSTRAPQVESRRLAAVLPVLAAAGLLAVRYGGPAPVVAVADPHAAAIRAATRRALVAGGGLPPDEWAAAWAAYWTARGQVAPPAAAPLNWHEWQEPAAQEAETAA